MISLFIHLCFSKVCTQYPSIRCDVFSSIFFCNRTEIMLSTFFHSVEMYGHSAKKCSIRSTAWQKLHFSLFSIFILHSKTFVGYIAWSIFHWSSRARESCIITKDIEYTLSQSKCWWNLFSQYVCLMSSWPVVFINTLRNTVFVTFSTSIPSTVCARSSSCTVLLDSAIFSALYWKSNSAFLPIICSKYLYECSWLSAVRTSLT